MARRISLLVVALAAVAFAACGGDKSSSAPEPDGPAGEVVELSGTVTAEASGKSRPLAVGDKVSATDTIVTAEGASVAIRLFHNDARWELGGGKKRVVRKSLAWSAPKGSQVAGAKPNDTTMAAGRHAERQAGTTTAVRDVTPADKDTTAEPPKVGGRETSTQSKSQSPKPQSPEVLARPSKQEPKRKVVAAARPKTITIKKLAKKLNDHDGAHGVGPKLGDLFTKGKGLGKREHDRERGGGGDVSRPGGKKKAEATGKLHSGQLAVVSGTMAPGQLRTTLRRNYKLFLACYRAQLVRNPLLGGKLRLLVTIDAKGKVTRLNIAGDAPLKTAIGKCVGARTMRVMFPAPGAPVRFVHLLLFSP